jgi:hypothetical protein
MGSWLGTGSRVRRVLRPGHAFRGSDETIAALGGVHAERRPADADQHAGLSLPRPSPPHCATGATLLLLRRATATGSGIPRSKCRASSSLRDGRPAPHGGCHANAERREDRSVQTRSGRCRHRTKGPRPRASELRRPVPRTTTADYCGCRASGRSVESMGGTGGQKRLVQITSSD